MNGFEPAWFMVEGPDGAGKTTVAKELAYMLAHRPDPRPCVVQCLDFNSTREDYITRPMYWLDAGLNVVQDRGVLSGPIYEPLFRRDMDRLAWMDPLVELAASLPVMVVLMNADVQVLEERVAERGDDYVTPDTLADIHMGYAYMRQRWEDAGGKLGYIDTTHSFPGELEIQMMASCHLVRSIQLRGGS